MSNTQPMSGGAPPQLSGPGRFLYGGIGATAPIIVALLAIDFSIVFKSFDIFSFMGWFVRSIILFMIGGFVAFLHKNENDSWKCFVIGISAPALITTAAATSAKAESIDNKIISYSKSIEILSPISYRESNYSKFSRGFSGNSPTIFFSMFPATRSESDARIATSWLNGLNACTWQGKVRAPFANEFNTYSRNLRNGFFNVDLVKFGNVFIPIAQVDDERQNFIYTNFMRNFIEPRFQNFSSRANLYDSINMTAEFRTDQLISEKNEYQLAFDRMRAAIDPNCVMFK